jgi:hypothetical protein
VFKAAATSTNSRVHVPAKSCANASACQLWCRACRARALQPAPDFLIYDVVISVSSFTQTLKPVQPTLQHNFVESWLSSTLTGPLPAV